MWRHPTLELGSHMPSFTDLSTTPRLSEFQAALTCLRNSLDCPNCRPPATPHPPHKYSTRSQDTTPITCSSSSLSPLNSRVLTTNVVAEAQAAPVPNSEGASNLSRSTLGLNAHPGRRDHAARFLTTSLRQATQNPNLAHGRKSPCSSQPSFRSRSCHWPKAGILQDLFQLQVVHLTRITLLQPPAGHQSDPVPATDHSTNPPNTVPISVTHTTLPPYLYLIQTQGHPRPVPHSAPVHLTHSQQRHLPFTCSSQAESGPSESSPAPVFVQAREPPCT